MTKAELLRDILIIRRAEIEHAINENEDEDNEIYIDGISYPISH